MILHKDERIFRDSILATAQHLSAPEVFIEKDCVSIISIILKEFFTLELSAQVVFKGGNSLSKMHNLLKQFSEVSVVFQIDWG